MYKSLFFAGIVCFFCSIILAITTDSLKPLQEYNIKIDQKKNILKALNIIKETKISPKVIETKYKNNIQEIVINKKGQKVNTTIEEASKDDNLLFLYKTKSGNIAIPVEGMGLWSLLQGYLALDKDGKTVKGITFYEQKETPGLGAEIAQNWFTNNFIGKSILDKNNKLVGIYVAKGKAENQTIVDLNNAVDGISGATITAKGVTSLIKEGIEDYKNYLKQMWENNGK